MGPLETIDINQDGHLDLVQTADSSKRGGQVWTDEGGSYWKVWLGETNGFSSTHERWSVPDSGLSDGFFSTTWSQNNRHFRTMDLDADGRPDLVQTADPNETSPQVHADDRGAYWRVWRGNEQGFETQWFRWAVPSASFEEGYFSPTQAYGTLWFDTLDMGRDGPRPGTNR